MAHHPTAPHEEHHEGAPEWLISFADNVALMMGFFVILLAMNMRPAVDTYGGGDPQTGNADVGAANPNLLDWAIALREAFNNPVRPDSTDPEEAELVARVVQRAQAIRSADPAPKGPHEGVQTLRQSAYYGLGGVVYFESDSSELSPEQSQRVAEIAEHVRGLRTVIEVRGHCSASEAYGSGDHGMQFSWERARAVTHALANLGVDWPRMQVIACGRNGRPARNEYDPAAVRSNQCVEVVITSLTAGE
jgi:outer membrane protein OmpA-like peptidoglycan-associated protein